MGTFKKLVIGAVSMLGVVAISQTYMYIYKGGKPVESEKVADIDSVGFSEDGKNVRMYKGKTVKKSVSVTDADSIAFNPFISIEETVVVKETVDTVSIGFECEPKGHLEAVDVEWTSTNENVAKVKGGIVYPQAAGKCVVYAEYGYQKLACEVIINPVSVEIANGDSVINISRGKDINAFGDYLIFGRSYRNAKITYESANSKIASLDAGCLVGVSDGITYINVLADGKKIGEIMVNVNIPIIVNEENIMMEQGEKVPLNEIFVLGRKYAGASIKYISSDEKVASIVGSEIVGASDGVAVVSVLANDEVIGKTNVDVNKTIAYLQETVMLEAGDSTSLDSVFVLGHRWKNLNITYTISDKGVASIVGGKINGLADGVATVKVLADTKEIGGFVVDVNKTIVIPQDTLFLDVERAASLPQLYTLGHRLAKATITYSLSNPEIASIADGIVTAKADGVSNISIIADGKNIGKIFLDVNKNIEFKKTELLIDAGESVKLSDLYVLGHRHVKKSITYTLTNDKLASVKDGVITGLADGMTSISINADGALFGTIKLDVNKPITMKADSVLIDVAQTSALTSCYTLGHRYTAADVSYSIADTTIATLSGAKVTGVADGVTLVSVLVKGKKEAQIFVDVNKNITIKTQTVMLDAGEKDILIKHFTLGHRHVNKVRTYTVENEKVAYEKSGEITGLADGVTKVSINVGGTLFGEIPVDVNKPVVLKEETVYVDVAKNATLSNYYTLGHRYTSADVSYTIADSTIATIAEGKVTGVADGITSASIFVKGKKEAEITIDVNKNITINTEKVMLDAGETQTLSQYYTLGHRHVKKQVAYEVEDAKVASENGVAITGLADGVTSVKVLVDSVEFGTLNVDVDKPIVSKSDTVFIDVTKSATLTDHFVLGHRYTAADVTYSIDDTTFAKLSEGSVVGVADGLSIVSIYVKEKMQDSILVDVNKNIEFKTEKLMIDADETAKLADLFTLGHRHTNKPIAYIVGDTTIAAEKGGVITGLADGVTSLTVNVGGVKFGEINVDVDKPITMKSDSVLIDVTKTATLSANFILGHRYVADDLSYSIADSTIATLNNGVVTGVADGITKAAVLVKGVEKATILIDVNKDIEILRNTLLLDSGDSGKIADLYKLGHRHTSKNIVYAVASKSIATEADGVITGVADGTTTVSINVGGVNFGTIDVDVNDPIVLKKDTVLVDVEKNASLTDFYTLGHRFKASDVSYSIADSTIAALSGEKVVGAKDGITSAEIVVGGDTAVIVVDVNKTIEYKGSNNTIEIEADSTVDVSQYFILGHRYNNSVITYSVDNDKLASMDNSVATGLNDGIAIIAIAADGKQIGSIRLDVNRAITPIKDKETVLVDVDKTATLTDHFTLGHKYNKANVVYKLADTTIASISGGVVTGLQDGVSTIEVIADSISLGELTLDVNKTITYVSEDVRIDVKETVNLAKFYTLGHRYSEGKITYTLSDTKVATVERNNLTGVADGVATIDIFSNNVKVGALKLDVNETVILNQDTVYIDKREETSVSKVYTLGHRYKNSKVTFELSDEKVASLSGGVIRGLADGVTTVSVFVDSVLTTEFVVDVNETLIMNVNDAITLVADVDMYRMRDYCTIGHRHTGKVVYRSTNEELLTVNSKGRLKGLAETEGSKTVDVEVIIGGKVLGTVSFKIISAFVDLGLPSGTLWATVNVGAATPTDFGNYFAWGEVKTKSTFTESNYAHAEKTLEDLQKAGIVEPNGNLYLQYDAANKILGNLYRMPTKAQVQELVDNCYIYTSTLNGVDVYVVSGSNGKKLYIPLSGQFTDELTGNGSSFTAWSATDASASYVSNQSYTLSNKSLSSCDYYKGNVIRAVANIVHYNIVMDNSGDEEKLVVGEELTPQITVYPDTAKYAFRSTNEKVAIVENGTIKAKGEGSCVIYVFPESADDKEDSCLVTVRSIAGAGQFVDLGLASGTLWMSSNVGATSIEQAGDYVAWGETAPKSKYVSDTYAWAGLNEDSLKARGVADADGNLTLDYDAAYQNLGVKYKTPTQDQVDEMRGACNSKWTTINGQKGYLYTSWKTGNSIFMPAAGYVQDTTINNAGSALNYWTTRLISIYESPYGVALNLTNDYNYYDYTQMNMYRGLPVRPVSYYYIDINDSLKLSQNVSKKLKIKIQPEGSEYTLRSTDKNVATVTADGLVKTVGIGECWIIATSVDNPEVADTCEVISIEGGECGFVDLGLPSGTMWATCNVGAASPEEYGDYFAFGETSPRKDSESYVSHDWTCLTRDDLIAKGVLDASGNLNWKYDAAFAYLGNGYGIPTSEQMNELKANCNVTKDVRNGVEGYLFTSKENGNSVFFPKSGRILYNPSYSINSYFLNVGEELHSASASYYEYEKNYRLNLSVNESSTKCEASVSRNRIESGLTIRPVKRVLDIRPADILQDSVSMYYKDTIALNVAVWPETEQYVLSSTNEKVATVSPTGIVVPQGVGECMIIATAASDKTQKDTCYITVKSPTIQIETKRMKVQTGDEFHIQDITVTPSNMSYKVVSSSDICNVFYSYYYNRFLGEGLKSGDCKLIASVVGYEEIADTIDVQIRDVLIDFASDTLTMSANIAKTINVSLSSSNETYTVKSTDNSIAVVTKEGKVRTVGEGTCKLIATVDGKPDCTDTCLVIVTPGECQFIDLGLPSGTKWASCNIGASSPTEYGDYFYWGKTSPMENYYMEYVCGNTLSLQAQGIVDENGDLSWKYDAAFAYMGNGYAMPTKAQIEELVDEDNTIQEEVEVDGVKGFRFTSIANGNSIFLPYAGTGTYYQDSGEGRYGTYLSSSSTTTDGEVVTLDIINEEADWDTYSCQRAFPIRPVNKVIEIKAVDIQQTSVQMLYKDSTLLTINADEGVEYTIVSTDTTVATISANGMVKPHSVGECMIIASLTDMPEYADTCLVSVISPTLSIEESKIKLVQGTQQPINLTYSPSNMSVEHKVEIIETDYIYVAHLYDYPSYSISGGANGKANIIVYLDGYEEISDTVYVEVVSSIIDFGTDTLELPMKTTKTLSVTKTPSDITYTLESDNYSVAVITEDNAVKAVGKGICNIISTTSRGDKDTLVLKVVDGVCGFIDLGLPSGTKWYSCNLGAVDPTDAGETFAWGNPLAYNKSSKYLSGEIADLKQRGCIDADSNFVAIYDAAYRMEGEEFAVPTKAQFEELLANTTSESVVLEGVKCIKLVSKENNNAIYLPESAYYWTSTVASTGSNSFVKDFAYVYGQQTGGGFNTTGGFAISQMGRKYDCNIRPVSSSSADRSAVAFDQASLNIYLGDTETLSVSKVPSDAAYTFASSDETVATVSATGEVTPVSQGECDVTVTMEGKSGASATCHIVVKPYSITLSSDTVYLLPYMRYGSSAQKEFPVVTDPNSDYTFKIANESIVQFRRVSSSVNYIMGMNLGETDITFTMKDHDDVYAVCHVVVAEAIIDVTEKNLDMALGSNVSLRNNNISVTPTNAACIFTTSDATVATVNGGGTVTAVGEGECIITVALTDGSMKREVNVSVKEYSLTVNESLPILYVGKPAQVPVTVKPSGAKVNFYSGYTNIEVQGDTLIPLAVGEAEVRYTYNNPGTTISGSIKFTITDDTTLTHSVNISSDTVAMFVKDAKSVPLSYFPTAGTLTYLSGDSTVAVAERGWDMNTNSLACKITGVGEGSCYVYVSLDGYPEVIDSIYVQVEQKYELSLGKNIPEMYVDETPKLSVKKEPSAAKVIYTSSNPAVATVSDDGVITAVGLGDARIFAMMDRFNEVADSVDVSVVGSYNTENFVDLGLSSKTIWATKNVGATSIEGFGSRFAWGETAPKSEYTDVNSIHNGKDQDNLQYEGVIYYEFEHDIWRDDIYSFAPNYDAASVNSGIANVTPSRVHFQELIRNCNTQIVTYKGVNGCRFVSKKNGNVLFLPAAGRQCDMSWWDPSYGTGDNWIGNYWTADPSNDNAICLRFDIDSKKVTVDANEVGRYVGASVRPIQNLNAYQISTSTSKMICEIGVPKTFEVTVTPDTARVIYTSSDTTVAKVSENGEITAVGAGACTITATVAEVNTKSVQCNIFVKGDANVPLIDLALPSRTLWAESNVGAASVEDLGYRFGWGSLQEVDGYYASDYLEGKQSDLLASGDLVEIDGEIRLAPSRDVATSFMGSAYQMPTKAQAEELLKYCTKEDVRVNGRYCYKFTGPNGNSILLRNENMWTATSRANDYGSYAYYFSTSSANDYTYSERANYIRAVGTELAPVTYLVKLNKDSLELIAGEVSNECVPRAVLPATEDYVMTSSDDKVATVTSEGVVTAVSAGECMIIASLKSKPEVADTCYLTVNAMPAISYIDLGLPTGTLWGNMNIGAKTPTEKGLQFAWGETIAKKEFDYNDIYRMNEDSLKKLGIIDASKNLTSSYDAATKMLGAEYKTPTANQIQELIDYCDVNYTYDSELGNYVVMFTSKVNGASISFPTYSYCMSSTLQSSSYSDAIYAYFLLAEYSTYLDYRASYRDFTVRPVMANEKATKYVKVECEESEKTIAVGNKNGYSEIARIKPVSTDTLVFFSTDTTIAKITKETSSWGDTYYYIHATGVGECDVIFTIDDADAVGKTSDTCHITVEPVTYTVSPYNSSYYLNVDDKTSVEFSVRCNSSSYPSEDTKCMFVSSDTTIVKIDPSSNYYRSVRVIGVGEGECEITAILLKDTTKTATCKVTVYPKQEKFVDLGLTSGTLWASVNIGESEPYRSGNKYAFGSLKNYGYNGINGSEDELKASGVIDENSNLSKWYDAAFNYDNEYQMPTNAQMQELLDECTFTPSKYKGYNCFKVTGPSGKSIYMYADYSGYFRTSTLVNGVPSVLSLYWSENNPSAKISTSDRDETLMIRPVKASFPFDVKQSALDLLSGNSSALTVYNPDSVAVSYVSSDEAVATVSAEGVVTAVSKGTCTITISNGTESKTCTVTVANMEDYFVDLGLPSGTLWSNVSLGANTPFEAGDYYAWGELATKENFYSNDYYNMSREDLLSNGIVDESYNLLPAYDAATAALGADYRIPTKEQFEELMQYCDYERKYVNGIYVLMFTSKSNGKSIIFSTNTGYKKYDWGLENSYEGYFMSATAANDESTYIFDSNTDWREHWRFEGYTIRPVKVAK